MTELFVDTSAWCPIADRSHPDHERLSSALRDRVHAGEGIVTTNLVLAETHALLLRRLHRGAALEFLTLVREPPNTVVVSDYDLEIRSQEEWLVKCDDQSFSMTDAVSFAVMEDRQIEEALALDRHFLVAGFAIVP